MYEWREIFISFRESIPIKYQVDILFPLGLLCPPSLSLSPFSCVVLSLFITSYISSFCFTFASCYIYNALLPEATMEFSIFNINSPSTHIHVLHQRAYRFIFNLPLNIYFNIWKRIIIPCFYYRFQQHYLTFKKYTILIYNFCYLL